MRPFRLRMLCTAIVWLVSLPLKAEVLPPERFVLNKFKDHDIVFLGEMHWVRGNLEFLIGLIPRLHAAGIYNLGWEFAHYTDQPLIDRLVSGETYDKDLAYAIILSYRQPGRVFAYQEYEAVYRAVWSLNRSLPKGAQSFRIVALNVPAVRQSWEMPGDTVSAQRFIGWTDLNVYWANVIMKEFVDRELKALVYCGAGHTSTKFLIDRGPAYGLTTGNVIHQNIGRRATTIVIHGSAVAADMPVAYAVERALAKSNPYGARFGIDLAGTELGEIAVEHKGYVDGKSAGLKLSDVEEGYLFLAPISQWVPVKVLPDFVTPRNRWAVQSNLPGYKPGEAEKSIAEINRELEAYVRNNFPPGRRKDPNWSGPAKSLERR